MYTKFTDWFGVPWKAPPIESCSTYQRQVISVRTFHIYFPNLVKFGLRDLRVRLLTFVSFEKIVAVKSVLFLWQYLETIRTRVQARETAWLFASKECVVWPMCTASLLFFFHKFWEHQSTAFWDTQWCCCVCYFLLFGWSLNCKYFFRQKNIRSFPSIISPLPSQHPSTDTRNSSSCSC